MTRASSSASSVDSFGGCVGLEELRGALETSYDTINKKRTNTYSQQEILLFLNDESFFPLVRQIISEIQYLEEGKTSPKSDVKQKEALLSFIQSRGYLLPRESLSSLGTSEEDFSLKRLLLYNLLADLQTCRLLAKKRIRRDLAFASLAGPGEGEGNERRSHAVEDQAKEKSQQALEMIKKISNTLGVYTEKEGCCDTFRDAVQLDLLSKALEKNGRSHPLPQSKEALVPAPPPSSTSGDKLLSIVERLDAEYLLRRRVMLRRLDVTVQAFLWSRKAQENDRAVATVLQDMRSWRDRLLNRHINLYDVFAIKKSLFTTRLSLPISRSTMCDEEEGRDTCPSSSSSRSPLAIKNLIIGPVPDRGGIPEGYSMHQVRQDVLRANEYMRSKDSSSSSSTSSSFDKRAPRGGGGSFSRGSSYNHSASSPHHHYNRGGGGGGQGRGGGRSFYQSPTDNYFSSTPSANAAGGGGGPGSGSGASHQHHQHRFTARSASSTSSYSYGDGGGGGGRGGRGGRGYNNTNPANMKGNTSHGSSYGEGGRRGGFGGRASDRPATWNSAR